jgi:hypothetical protein
MKIKINSAIIKHNRALLEALASWSLVEFAPQRGNIGTIENHFDNVMWG